MVSDEKHPSENEPARQVLAIRPTNLLPLPSYSGATRTTHDLGVAEQEGRNLATSVLRLPHACARASREKPGDSRIV